MPKQQHREAFGRRPTVVQAALVALVLLALAWNWQRPVAAPQQLPAGPREPYITDLVLPLDVGTLAQQVGSGWDGRRRGGGDARAWSSVYAALRSCLHAARLHQLLAPKRAGESPPAAALAPSQAIDLRTHMPPPRGEMAAARRPLPFPPSPLPLRQAEADAWCSTRTQLSWPPTPQQLRSLRVAIVVDPVCRQQVRGWAAAVAAAGRLQLRCGCRQSQAHTISSPLTAG